MSVPARCRAGLVALASACVLVGCAVPPTEPPAVADGTVQAQPPGSVGAPSAPLTPLERDMAAPANAPARSTVAAVSYELTSKNADLPPDDGIPGDASPLQELERGGASWYGIQFHQRRTASGERFDMGALTAAHKTLPFGSRVCVRSLVNGREVMVRINDRGPFTEGRVIDLSRSAADAIGLLGLGIKQVALSVILKGQKCGDVVNEFDDVDIAETVATPSLGVRRAPVARKKVVQAAKRPVVKARR
ncbi:MAG: septal ring lytic transglycosylase RlpA family protein [Pseudomonadota bacterium]